MRIIILSDNTPSPHGEYPGEPGFSAWIETPAGVFLFDTGLGPLFARNLARAGLDSEKPRGVILSHGHYDHGGGINIYRALRQTPWTLYRRQGAFRPKYSRLFTPEGWPDMRYLGLPFPEGLLSSPDMDHVILSEDSYSLGPQTTLEGGFGQPGPDEAIPDRFVLEEDGGLLADEFFDEQVLAYHDDEGLTVLTGCAHPGVLNIVTTLKERYQKPVHTLIGGWHLKEKEPSLIEKIMHQLQREGVLRVGGCHCTGHNGIQMMKSLWQDQALELYSGKEINLS